MVNTLSTYPQVSKKTRAKPFHRAGASNTATLSASDSSQAGPLDFQDTDVQEAFMIVIVPLGERRIQNRLVPNTVQQSSDSHGAGGNSDHPETADQDIEHLGRNKGGVEQIGRGQPLGEKDHEHGDMATGIGQ